MLSCAVWYQAAQICAVLSMILLMRDTHTDRDRQRDRDTETQRYRYIYH